MATQGLEVEVLGQGTDQSQSRKGSYVLNMFRDAGAWEVRAGFGQLAQFDSTLRMNVPGIYDDSWLTDPPYGYKKHLGSYLMVTDFGHEQIVSVFTATVHTADWNGRPAVGSNTQFIDLYVVSIYDVTTDERVEEPVYSQTSSMSEDVLPMIDWHGNYATCRRGRGISTLDPNWSPAANYTSTMDDEFQTFIHASDPEPVFFAEMGDILFFGNKDTGLLAYLPCIFSRDLSNTRIWHRDKQVNGAHHLRDNKQPYEESSFLVKAVGTEGVFPDAFVYLGRHELPATHLAAVVLGRLSYVVDRTVYFSDVGFPTSIVADNYIQVPSQKPITAITELNGNLYLFTESETFHYNPPAQFLASGGILTQVSEHIGCVGQNAIVKDEQDLFWVDRSGVYTTTGNLVITRISDPIDRFFQEEGLANPLTSYFADTGAVIFSELVVDPPRGLTSFEYEMPRMRAKFRPDMVNVTWHQDMKALIVSVPGENVALVLTEGEWSVWSFDSVVHTTDSPEVPKVDITANIQNAWFLSNGKRLFVVGGPETWAYLDYVEIRGSSENDDWCSQSYYICEYGRGGALDRTSVQEDYRQFTGKWDKSFSSAGPGEIIVGKPMQVPAGLVLPDQVQPGIHPNGEVWAEDSQVFLVPVYVCPWNQPTEGIASMRIRFYFDNEEWVPIVRDPDPVGYDPALHFEISFLLPPERQGMDAGYSNLGTPVAGRRVVVWDQAAGLPNANGNMISIEWTVPPAALYTGMNLIQRALNPLIWLPFYKKTAQGVAHMGVSFGGVGVLTELTGGNDPPAVYNYSAWVWEQAAIDYADRTSTSLRAQAVDWAYKPPPVGLNEGQRIQCRGAYVRALSHGRAGDPFESTWHRGLCNGLFGSDYREWVTQTIDASGDAVALEVDANKTGIRARVQNAAGVVATKVFGTNLRWGNSATAAEGNYLVDDEEVNTLALSVGVKGEWASLMLYGHMQDRAERLRIESIKAVIRPSPGRRRRTHG